MLGGPTQEGGGLTKPLQQQVKSYTFIWLLMICTNLK